MALIGICSSPSLECVYTPCSGSRTLRIMPPINRIDRNFDIKSLRISCSLSNEAVSSSEFKESAASTSYRSSNATVPDKSVEDEFSHVIKFKLSDFRISDRVSIGLTGRVKFIYIHIQKKKEKEQNSCFETMYESCYSF